LKARRDWRPVPKNSLNCSASEFCSGTPVNAVLMSPPVAAVRSHGFSRQEAAREGKGDSLEVNRVGIGDRLLDLRGFVRNRGGERNWLVFRSLTVLCSVDTAPALSVTACCCAWASASALLAAARASAASCCACATAHPWRKIALQAVDLRLHLGAQSLNLVLHRRTRRRWRAFWPARAFSPAPWNRWFVRGKQQDWLPE
jgi:hypothetical protein